MKIQKNLLKAFAAVSLGLGISLGTISNGKSEAATVIYDFEVRNLTGSLSGNTYTGFFSYDDSLPANQMSGSGLEIITSSVGDLSFSFDFLGVNYDETNDPYDRTQVSFNNGVADSISYWGNYDIYPSSASNTFTFNTTVQTGPGIFTDVDFSYLIDSGVNAGSGIGDVFITRRHITPAPIELSMLRTRIDQPIPKPLQPVVSIAETSLIPSYAVAQRIAPMETTEYEGASVPEPGTVFGIGAVVLGLMMKKKKALKTQ